MVLKSPLVFKFPTKHWVLKKAHGLDRPHGLNRAFISYYMSSDIWVVMKTELDLVLTFISPNTKASSMPI